MAHTGIDQEVALTSNRILHNNSLGHSPSFSFFSIFFSFFLNYCSYVWVAHNNLGRDSSLSLPQWDTKTMLICYFRRVFLRDSLNVDFLVS